MHNSPKLVQNIWQGVMHVAQIKNIKNCKNFKGLEMDLNNPLRQNAEHSCQHCVYFSKRNCGMDVADSIEPAIDLFS